MNAIRSGEQQPRFGGAAQQIYRFTILLGAMIAGIGILVIVEATLLWRLGIAYAPRMSIQSVSVCEFAVDDNGHRAVSRIAYVRGGHRHRVRNEVLIHDMHAHHQAHRLDLPGDARQLAIATQAGRIAIACYDGCIYTAANVCAPAPLQLLGRVPSGDVNRLACSADGQFVAAVDSHFLYLWRVAGPTLIHRLELPLGPVAALAFSDNAQHVLVCTMGGRILLWDVAHGSVCKAFQSRTDIHRAVLSPQGDAIMLLSADGGLWRCDLRAHRSSELELKLNTKRCAHGAAAFSRDGSTVAVVSHRGDFRYYIAVWDAKTCRQTSELQIGSDGIKGLQFAADGTLYIWDHQGTIQSWNAERQSDRWHFRTLLWARTEPSLKNVAPLTP